MASCDNCPSKANCNKNITACNIKFNNKNNIKNIIGIMSAKGGVGKSTISSILAKSLNKQGFKVGLMDADITGSCISYLLNTAKDTKVFGNISGEMLPIEKDGIKLMSLNFLVEDESAPVIWRGNLLSNCVSQFFLNVIWGELDYLIIDMPPGTSDIALTIMQTIPLTGIFIVSIPHSMVSMIVLKSINMAKKMNIKIYGIIQNMCYILCPNCNEKIFLHENNDTTFFEQNDIKIVANLPITKSISNISNIEFENIENVVKAQFKNILEHII